jgi:predicted phosphoribosyltransferase
VVDGAAPEIVLNDEIVADLGVSQAYIDAVAERELATIERRRKLWLGGKPYPDLAGQTVILVDDGIATGATMRAALLAVRRRHPARLVVAAPVAPPQVVRQMQQLADEVVCLITPEIFGAIGFFYADFAQVEDDEVGAILKRETPLPRADED